MNKNASYRNYHVHKCFSDGIKGDFGCYHKISCSILSSNCHRVLSKCDILGYCVTNKQELKTKHNNKLAISQKFVISLLFEGAENELQMDCYLQFLSVPLGLGGCFLQCHHHAVFKIYT